MLICTTCARESPDGFAFCPACGTTLEPVDPAREVRKVVTLVFCDLAGSTSLGEQLDPESLRDVQTRYFETMRVAIERHGGRVEKYIGDAVVAVFGIPRIHEDDALRAARAAIDMRDGLAALNTSLERDRGVTIQVRIGVNTGEVVAGDPTAGQALVTGDAVNVAARLEQHAAPGEILLGANIYRLVRAAVHAEPVTPLEVKGKAEPLSAWRLLDVVAVPSAVPRRQGSTMVGRDPELGQLRAAYATAVETRSCRFFTLLGSGGLGKSRLVEEFVSDLGDRATVALGVCLPYGEGITYYPIVESIKGAAGLTDLDGPDAVEAAISSVIEGDEHRALISRNLSSLISSTGSLAVEETFWAVRRFFEAVASERPLVLVFDDIQWGESTFLDLVEHFADLSRGSPILLLCMARPELLDVRPAWGSGKPNAETASLAPLTQDQAETLVANLLGSSERPAWLATEIVGRAEGNPLFLEETFGMLVDDGLLVSGTEGWTAAAELADVAVPPSISALLAARLDRLTPQERAVIEAAAVVGREFSISVVRDLLPEDAHDRVPSDLMALVRKELVQLEHASLPGEDAMRFRHLLIRDAAYEAIAKTRRAELHERVADRLEERRDGEGEHDEIVGYHLERAWAYRTLLGPPDARSDAIGTRAAGRLASAGRRAVGRRDAPAAVNLLRRALKVGSPTDTGRTDILFHLGIALAESGDTVSAIAALDEATLLAEARGERSVEWLARINGSDLKGEVDPHSISTDALVEELHTAIRTFEELGDEAGLASAWQILAFSESCRVGSTVRSRRRDAA
jgi:class 3 adenylate cyclase